MIPQEFLLVYHDKAYSHPKKLRKSTENEEVEFGNNHIKTEYSYQVQRMDF